MAVAHLTLATRDVERTVSFFEKALGWPRVRVPGNAPRELSAAWVEIGPGQQIHVLRIDGFTDPPSPFENEFGRHFAVFHPHADFPALKRRLAEHGGTLIDPIRPTPFERFFFKDPNGYMFEVIAHEQYVRE